MTDLTQLISDLETQELSRKLADRVLEAWGYWIEPGTKADFSPWYTWYAPDGFCLGQTGLDEDDDLDRPNPLQSIDDALLGMPEGLTYQLGPGLSGNYRMALIDEPEWFYRSSNPRPVLASYEATNDPLALTIAICRALQAMEEQDG